eukprot:TRINITY_DN2680_c0_g1_i11.p1 TRINITY_DN2680_c0_g1~~TRINITY_DN2680_c0_g1_i11.p1  ORF type:complete len:319 (+),score=107.34 TRINITY_DN2680_c0_g1_i11:866-1822(+)
MAKEDQAVPATEEAESEDTSAAEHAAAAVSVEGSEDRLKGTQAKRSMAAGMETGELESSERIMEYQRREYAMLSKFAQREREMRKLSQQAAEAFHAVDDNRKDSLRGAFIDPSVNLEIGILRQRLRDKDQEIAQLREEMQNAQFNPTSIQGKKLLDKCAHLIEENAEIARQLTEEKMQVLRIQLAAERQKRSQLRQRIAEFDRHAEQVDAENERMQKKIADLGQSLKETRTEIDKSKKDIEQYGSGKRKRELPANPAAATQAAEAPPAAEVPAAQPVVAPAAAGVAPEALLGAEGAKRRKKDKKDKDKSKDKTKSKDK